MDLSFLCKAHCMAYQSLTHLGISQQQLMHVIIFMLSNHNVEVSWKHVPYPASGVLHVTHKFADKSTIDIKSVKLTFQATLCGEDDFTSLQSSTSLDCHFQKV